jgi:enoyl ACP reductase
MTTIIVMGLLDGKNIVITGVLTDASLAFGVAALAQQEGASIVLTGAGRALSLTERVARKLPQPVDVYELDVTVPEHLENVRDALTTKWGRVDGVLHAWNRRGTTCRWPCTSVPIR